MYYILHKDDGELIGVSNEETWASLEGISVVQLEGVIPDLNKVKWNKLTLAFESNDSPLTKYEFMSRFTSEERIAIRSSANVAVSDYIHLLELAQEIDIKNQTTIDGLSYLVSIGILTEHRVTEILA